MTLRRPRLRSLPLRRAALALTAGLALVVGCDDSDPVSEAINSASIELAAMSPGAVAGPSRAALDAEYARIVSSLTPIAQEQRGGAGQQAAANVLIARALYGLALTPMADAGDLQGRALARVTGVRAALRSYLGRSALSAAVGAYDPAPELKSIDAQVAGIRAAIAKARAGKAELDSQIEGLRAQIKERVARADAERARDGELRQMMSSVSQAEGLALLERAAEHRRAADALDADAADLEAQVSQVAPEATLRQLEVEALANQEQRLAQARKAVESRHAIAQAQAAEAGREAGADAEAFAQGVGEVRDLAQEFAAAVDETLQGLARAASAAQKARAASPAAAASAFGEAKQAEGDTHWMNAQTLDAYAGLLESGVAAQPALPGAAEMRSAGAEARSAQQAALEAATQAYQEARDSYQSVNAGERAAEAIRALDERLIQIIKSTSGGTIDLSAQLQEPAPEAAPQAPVETAQSGPSPRETVQAAIGFAQAKDFAGLKSLFHAADAEQIQVLDAVFAIAERLDRLDTACEAKFGVTLSEQMAQMGGQGGAAGAIDTADLARLSIDQVNFEVAGETATATMPGQDEPMNLRLVDGEWRIELFTPEMAPMIQASLPALRTMTPAIDPLTQRVEAGEFQSIEQVLQALMQAMMGGGGGG